MGDVGTSTLEYKDKESHLSMRPQDIGKLFNGILSAFKQTEYDMEHESVFIPPEIRASFATTVQCWGKKVCSTTYGKGRAKSDSDKAIEEVIKNATIKLGKELDRVVHDSANYRIPKIINRMCIASSYNSSCSQDLSCDSMDAVRRIDLTHLMNAASQIKLKNINDYASIQANFANSAFSGFSAGKGMIASTREHKDTHNSISPEAMTEVPLVLFSSVFLTTIVDKIFKKNADNSAEAICKVKTCLTPS